MGFFSRLLGSDAGGPESPPAADGSPSRQSPPPATGFNVGALTEPPAPPPASPPAEFDPAVTAELEPKVIDVIKTVFDPEIPVDVYELGLIYAIKASADRHVHVTMTLTSPACPSAQQLPSEIRYKVKAVEGVSDATVDVVWEPPWDKDRMSDAAKLQLGFF
ncbi:MAG: DUF59 domain-containing protein [Vicinamibacterales bacterium]